MKAEVPLTLIVKVDMSFWDAIKIRIAGFDQERWENMVKKMGQGKRKVDEE